MKTFMRLYGNLIVFVYHCFDRIVINGYLSMLSRPENVVYFFHKVVGISLITKEVLAQRTHDYQGWVKGFARNQNIPIQWAEKGVKKEEFVEPLLRRMERAKRYGVYFIFQSMEQGATLRSGEPSSPPLIRITKSSANAAAASPTTTFISATQLWEPWCCEWLRSCPFTPPIGSTAITSSR